MNPKKALIYHLSFPTVSASSWSEACAAAVWRTTSASWIAENNIKSSQCETEGVQGDKKEQNVQIQDIFAFFLELEHNKNLLIKGTTTEVYFQLIIFPVC